MPPLSLPPNLKFGPFPISGQVFHLSSTRLSYALVNLKPILPGHVLICPVRVVPRFSQLTQSETTDLFVTVRRVSRTIERLFSATSLNIAIQDGVDAGQSVPHVHVHIIPRKAGDLDERGGGDAIYDMMDGEEGNVGKDFLELQKARVAKDRRKDFKPDASDDRKPRSAEEMNEEAAWLREEMEKDREEGSEEINVDREG